MWVKTVKRERERQTDRQKERGGGENLIIAGLTGVHVGVGDTKPT